MPLLGMTPHLRAMRLLPIIPIILLASALGAQKPDYIVVSIPAGTTVPLAEVT